MNFLKGILAGLFFTSVLTMWFVFLYKLAQLLIMIETIERMMANGR